MLYSEDYLTTVKGICVNIAVCDDQKQVLGHIVNKVKSVDIQCNITGFCNFSDLCEKIRDGEEYHVVLMDIEWNGEQKGIDYASQLHQLSPKTKIIFVTGYPERYSQEIFLKNTNLKGFIQKPIDTEVLEHSIKKINSEMKEEEKRKILVKYNGVITVVDPDEIIYIESRLHTITLYTEGSSHLCYEKLDALEKRLPAHFIRTHKSILINMDKIRLIERTRIVLEKSFEVPVSKSRYNECYESYFRYIGSTV